MKHSVHVGGDRHLVEYDSEVGLVIKAFSFPVAIDVVLANLTSEDLYELSHMFLLAAKELEK